MPYSELSDAVATEADPGARGVRVLSVASGRGLWKDDEAFVLTLSVAAARVEKRHRDKGRESTSSPGACTKQTRLMKK